MEKKSSILSDMTRGHILEGFVRNDVSDAYLLSEKDQRAFGSNKPQLHNTGSQRSLSQEERRTAD